MYPILDIDAQLLLATLFAAKRKPTELVGIVTAAELLGCPINSTNLWAESFRRLVTHGLIVMENEAYAPTPAAQAMATGLPKKADISERVFLIREKLSAYTPAEKSPSIPMTGAQFDEAIRAHKAIAQQGGRNLLMPKPKVDDDQRRPARRPFAGGRRRN
ncbi:MAG: hypothetical protein PHG21_18245 [Azoarcus sp.]|nr:hypothetical protein [Azoarcus sp.]MDD2875566.1 hypothetical protein [Azoarcus sp.]